jgi:hypothetical protein
MPFDREFPPSRPLLDHSAYIVIRLGSLTTYANMDVPRRHRPVRGFPPPPVGGDQQGRERKRCTDFGTAVRSQETEINPGTLLLLALPAGILARPR